MKIASPKFPSRAETPEVPEDARWIDTYIEPRDSNVKQLTQCLQGQVDLRDNLNAEVRDLEVAHDTDFVLTLKTLRGAPEGAEVIWADRYLYPILRWAPLDQQKLKFSVWFLSIPTDKVKIRLLVWGK